MTCRNAPFAAESMRGAGRDEQRELAAARARRRNGKTRSRRSVSGRPGDVAAVGDEEDELVGKGVRRAGERVDRREQLPEGQRKRPAGAQQTAERVVELSELVGRHRPRLRIEPEHAPVQRIGRRKLRRNDVRRA